MTRQMDGSVKNSAENCEKEKCIAHYWKSACNTAQISELTINTGIKSVALSSEHCLFLGNSGKVFARGCNKFGQLGLGDLVDRKDLTEVQYLSRKNVVDVECGSRHSGVLTEEGHVYCWGDAGNGQCGVGEMATVQEPARVYFIGKHGKDTSSVITQLAFGELHSLGLTNKGQVWAWGSGCTLGLGNDLARALTPQLVEDLIGKKVISIACGIYHSLAIIDVENSTNIKTSKDKDTVTPVEENSASGKRAGFSIRISRQNTKDTVERSNSMPITRKPNLPVIASNHSSSSESESDDDDQSPLKSDVVEPSDVAINVKNDSDTSEQSSLSGSLDAGIYKFTDAVVKSVSEMLSYTTSSLTNETSTSDNAVVSTNGPAMPEGQKATPKTKRKQVKNKSQGCNPVSVQVWAWGRGTFGQLGHGTTEDRPYPCLVDKLCGVHIVKVVAGNHHSLALTSYCQVYAWGDNTHAQLGIKKNVVNKPRKIESLSNILVWDIAAGSHYSLFLGDSFENKTNVYVCGKKPSGLPMSCMSSLMEYRDLFDTPVEPDEFFNRKSPVKKGSNLTVSKSETDISTITTLSQGVKIGQMKYFSESSVLRGIIACGEQCVCLSVREPSRWVEIVAKMASMERAFYYKLALIWQSMLEPLMVTALPALANNEQYGQTLTQICKIFHQVMRQVSIMCKRLEQVVNNVMLIADAVEILTDEKYFSAFEKYSKAHSDCVACGVLDCLGKDASGVFIESRFVFEKVLNEVSQSDGEAFKDILKLPLQRISRFAEKISVLQSSLTQNSTECKTLYDLAVRWIEFVSADEERFREATLTKEFWQECPPKLAETYKRPHRRLLKSSKVCDLFLPKSGRFSSHWFVLLSDTFFHIVSNRTFHSYDLSTVWASPVPDIYAENFTNAIKITTPEESFTVCSRTATEKAQWLVVINKAVAKVLSKTSPNRLSSETVNTRAGSFTPAKARQATYFYLQDPKYKGACYTGMWLSGKPHGHGKMVWASTAQTYEGELRNGLYNGFGRMIFVLNASAGVAEEYKGEWKDGMMHGQGEMSYSDKQVYIGHWMHNVRHGHGVLRMGTLTSAAPSIFTGNWDNDKRSGFGVMDDIMRGEKYMGMWENDVRSGNGLIVTLDGIYNEGRFSLNKLMGQGILLCHDNTKFEGDFCGDAQINGKGVLTMPNGDRIEGTFQGQLNEGLKINGMYFKGNGPEEKPAGLFSERAESPPSPYYIPASKKWCSVFNESRDRLGCLGNDEPDLKRAWKCVEEDLTRGPSENSFRQELEIIDDILKGVDLDQARKISKDKKKLQEYLTKAFNLACHPLGRLLETLVDVYRATYVGMGAHGRLLPHAVEEIKSYIDRMYAIIRILFPSLPDEGFVYVGNLNEADEQSEGDILDSNTLLGPLIFPRFYPPLFTLYALHNEKNDSAYWERVLQLNKRTDLALMSYLEVKRTFWLASEEMNGLVYEADLTNWKHTHYYEKAVDAFQMISTKFSPMEKLAVLKETFHRIHKEVQDFWKGKAKLMSLDDLFPVFQFVVIRSRVHHLGSEIDFIEDLMQAKYRAGEQGHMFTTLKACYYQILNEN